MPVLDPVGLTTCKFRRKHRKLDRTLPVMRSNAACIDIGATEIFVAVPADRDTESVRSFPTFTQDLHALADWLQQCRVDTVAMESTGVYWIPLFQILEARGIEVHLVNAQHVHHVPGRKSDVLDCQWLQYLHSVGLLRASFRPEQAVCEIRSLMRHRENLVQMACVHVQHVAEVTGPNESSDSSRQSPVKLEADLRRDSIVIKLPDGFKLD